MNITCENIRQHYEGKLSLSPPSLLQKVCETNRLSVTMKKPASGKNVIKSALSLKKAKKNKLSVTMKTPA